MCVCVCVYTRACTHMLSHVQLFVNLWTGAHQAPLSVGFSRQEYWSGLPFPYRGDLSDPWTKPMSLGPSALAGRSLPLSYLGSPKEPVKM